MIKFLLENRTEGFTPKKTDKQFSFDGDNTYLKFISEHNGGYFFNNSLHLFGTDSEAIYHDLLYRNNFFKMNYGNMVENLFFIGEDLFGNAFAFEEKSICLFNIETGEKEILASDFKAWLLLLKNDLDYLTGVSFTKNLSESEIASLAKGKRLSAKYPFVLGGAYAAENLAFKSFEENLEYNSLIAKQIKDLPDGAQIKIEIT